MRSASKAERCIAGAKKCSCNARSYNIAISLAPTLEDSEFCKRKYDRAIRHACKYLKLADYYYGGK